MFFFAFGQINWLIDWLNCERFLQFRFRTESFIRIATFVHVRIFCQIGRICSRFNSSSKTKSIYTTIVAVLLYNLRISGLHLLGFSYSFHCLHFSICPKSTHSPAFAFVAMYIFKHFRRCSVARRSCVAFLSDFHATDVLATALNYLIWGKKPLGWQPLLIGRGGGCDPQMHYLSRAWRGHGRSSGGACFR